MKSFEVALEPLSMMGAQLEIQSFLRSKVECSRPRQMSRLNRMISERRSKSAGHLMIETRTSDGVVESAFLPLSTLVFQAEDILSD